MKLSGKSVHGHPFDFVVPMSKVFSERISCAFNRPNREADPTMVFAWPDTNEVRAPESRACAILNESEQQPVSQSVLDAMRTYDIPWSTRDGAREEFAA